MAELRNKFGKRLRKIRRDRDMTQEQLAEAVGVTMEFISRMERGHHGPSFDTLQKIAEVLEVEVNEFFQFPNDKND
jgi:transcriptional regulator with XRE-family HTH domain